MTIHHVHHFITDAGDAGLLLPMAVVAAVLLWAFASTRLAWLLLRSVAAAGLVILLLKMLFLSCGLHWIADLQSPSGHACLSAVVYGCLGSILGFGRPVRVRWAIGTLVCAIIIVISVSRISLGVHTIAEVSVGLAVGGMGWWWFARAAAAHQPPAVSWLKFGVGLGLTVLIAFGARFPAESVIRHLARHLAARC